MNIFVRSSEFERWLTGLKDNKGRARIIARLDSAALGNFGDSRPVGEGVSEMRIHTGPGYRVYYVRRGVTVSVLLAGGDKSTQKQDIARALRLARDLKEELASNPAKVTYAPFDAADYLDSDEVIAEYLTAAAEDSNPGRSFFLHLAM